MRYIKSLLCAAAALAVSLASCTGDQALPPLTFPDGLGDSKIGNGSWDSPLSAYQASLGTIPHDEFGMDITECWVTGYIVGWVNVDVSNSNIELGADFSLPATVNTNILIASRPDETNPLLVASVQLPSGKVRDALNLRDNDGNMGKLVTIYGQVGSKYCGAYGVRSVSDYAWDDKGKEPDPNMVLPSGSINIWVPALLQDQQGFTFEQGGSAEIWKHSTQYGLVAKSTAAVSDAWAVSPSIDLTGFESPRIMLHQAANFFTDQETFRQMCRIVARVAGTDEWKDIELPYYPDGHSWNFGYSGYANLDEYAGKVIEIGLNYTSTPQVYGTWEIDKITVTGVYKK